MMMGHHLLLLMKVRVWDVPNPLAAIDPASAGEGAEPAAAVPVRLGGEDQVSVHSGSSKATPPPKGF